MKVGSDMWLQIFRARVEHAGTKPRFLKSGSKTLDFSNLSEMFGMFRLAHRKSETTFVEKTFDSVSVMWPQIFCSTPTGQMAAPPLTQGRLPEIQASRMGVDFIKMRIGSKLPPGRWGCADGIKEAGSCAMPARP
jgi:hypothetical protein